MDRELKQINVIPLVDVMLVLLVIILTTATFITTGQIPVNLAKASMAGERQDTALIIIVTAQRLAFVDDQLVADGQLDYRAGQSANVSDIGERAHRGR
jgi:biopolymer transport protein ExbD